MDWYLLSAPFTHPHSVKPHVILFTGQEVHLYGNNSSVRGKAFWLHDRTPTLFKDTLGNDGPVKQYCNFPSLTSRRKEWIWVLRSRVNSPLGYRPLKMRPLGGIETLDNKHPATKGRISEERSSQLHRYEWLWTCHRIDLFVLCCTFLLCTPLIAQRRLNKMLTGITCTATIRPPQTA
jgi:hypothetical protein